MNQLINYYKICGAKTHEDNINPIFNQLGNDIAEKLLGTNMYTKYITTKEGIYTMNETVIGGKRGKIEQNAQSAQNTPDTKQKKPDVIKFAFLLPKPDKDIP